MDILLNSQEERKKCIAQTLTTATRGIATRHFHGIFVPLLRIQFRIIVENYRGTFHVFISYFPVTSGIMGHFIFNIPFATSRDSIDYLYDLFAFTCIPIRECILSD